jgi:hypothetical protein
VSPADAMHVSALTDVALWEYGQKVRSEPGHWSPSMLMPVLTARVPASHR